MAENTNSDDEEIKAFLSDPKNAGKKAKARKLLKALREEEEAELRAANANNQQQDDDTIGGLFDGLFGNLFGGRK